MKELLEALAAFRADVGPVKKRHYNDYTKSTYEDLADCLAHIAPLGSFNLHLVQRVMVTEMGPRLDTELYYTGDPKSDLRMQYPLPSVDNPQQMKSAVSYARRASILCILGLGAEDDDGNMASQGPERSSRPRSIRSGSSSGPSTRSGSSSAPSKATAPQLRALGAIARDRNLDVRQEYFNLTGAEFEKMEDLTKKEASQLIDFMQGKEHEDIPF